MLGALAQPDSLGVAGLPAAQERLALRKHEGSGLFLLLPRLERRGRAKPEGRHDQSAESAAMASARPVRVSAD